jgi:hypothetical protein
MSAAGVLIRNDIMPVCCTVQAVDEFADISAAILKATQTLSFPGLFFQVLSSYTDRSLYRYEAYR